MHDILDYSILRKSQSQFEKNIEIFDLQQAVNEVIEIQHDKCVNKQIDLITEFNGFSNK